MNPINKEVMKKILMVFTVLLGIFTSCEKGEPATEVTPSMARDSLFDIMNQWYYWYDKMPAITKGNYADPYALLEALRYKPLDNLSYVMDYDDYEALRQGSFVGHGVRFGLDETGKARVTMIYKNAPLYGSGVRRGWIIKKINGVDLAGVLMTNDPGKLDELLGEKKEGVTNVFLFSPPGQADMTISSAKTAFVANTVMLYDTIHLAGGSVAGHMVLSSFTEQTSEELKTAFAYFSANNVKEFILDLRYNAGGLFTSARELASYLAGASHTGSVFLKIEYNDKNSDVNKTLPFIATQYPLSVSKLVVITTRSTKGASEVLMNGLDPKITVVSVGDTTAGMAYGSGVWKCDKKYFFFPVTCKTVNSLNMGEFHDGFPPDQKEIDDVTRDFDDRQEKCLMEAIMYLGTGHFSGKGEKSSFRSVQYSEEPPIINCVSLYEYY